MASYVRSKPTFPQYSPYSLVSQQFESDDYMIQPPPPPLPPKSYVRDNLWKSSEPRIEEHRALSNTGSFSDSKAFKPKDDSDDSQEDSPSYGPSMSILQKIGHVLRYLFIVAVVAVPFLVPLILYNTDATILIDDPNDQNQINASNFHNQVFYIFAWLETTWLAAVASNIIVLALPYVFFFVARYVNSSHRRYWRALRTLKWPFTFTGAIIAAYISFEFVSLPYHYVIRSC